MIQALAQSICLPSHPTSYRAFLLLIVALLIGGVNVVRGQEQDQRTYLQNALVIGNVGTYSRSPLHKDAIEALLVASVWHTPVPGDSLILPDGTVRYWELASADEEGWIEHNDLRGGYALIAMESEIEKVVLLEASGHSMVYVNGQPRAGDPYGYGFVQTPVLLRSGINEFLFLCGRGGVAASIITPAAPTMLNSGDVTLPDILPSDTEKLPASIVLINTTQAWQTGLAIDAAAEDGKATSVTVPALAPLSVRKVRFDIDPRGMVGLGEHPVHIAVKRSAGKGVIDTATILVSVPKPGMSYRRTFMSAIDGSVQYYAVNPASGSGSNPPALFLSLHGASVEAIGQARAYSPKSWGHIVAPTNRRPFGFDWEDWGRLDAMEVLGLAQKALGTDPARTYVTGHSMGGHGTWHLGATFPDKFAAIGPSAGWISFATYAGGDTTEKLSPMERMLARASAPSNTKALLNNYRGAGVYILHGDADDNVPVTEARTMRDTLQTFHTDLHYYEQPGAGHWWDETSEPGADCVDWALMFDLFARRALPIDNGIRSVQFTTTSPGVSAWAYWVGIEAQAHPLQNSAVDVRYDPLLKRIIGSTSNVARIAFTPGNLQPNDTLDIELDNTTLHNVMVAGGTEVVRFEQTGKGWKYIERVAQGMKTPERYGPFKEAFRNNVLFVYGTRGTTEENEWAYAKARYDAETFWYRGNGSVEIIADKDFTAAIDKERNVILYGNAQTNGAWKLALADCPVQIHGASVGIDGRSIEGGDLAALFTYPRAGSEHALVGVVGGTGIEGMRLAERLPYFVSGIAYPDVIVLGPEMLRNGIEGVRAAGFFGLDWSVQSGEFVWGE